jgi:hypothetical protein
MTLENFTEPEKIQTIKKGSQLDKYGKTSLKKYYENRY